MGTKEEEDDRAWSCLQSQATKRQCCVARQQPAAGDEAAGQGLSGLLSNAIPSGDGGQPLSSDGLALGSWASSYFCS